MTPIAEAIRSPLHVVPFVPFTVHVADQKASTVTHPDFATLTQGGGMLFVNTEGDRFEWGHLRMVTRIESADTSQQAA
jgi:hypothetical protein